MMYRGETHGYIIAVLCAKSYKRDEYLGKGPFGFWRDTGTRVVGNSVAVMNMRFFMDWKYATGKNIDVSAKYFPPCGNCGSDKMQLVSGGPDTKNNPIQKEYLKLVMLAKETIYIHTPYLFPIRH